MEIEYIKIPKWYEGIKPNDRGRSMRTYIIGADSETIETGEPFTFQFYSEDLDLDIIEWIDAKRSTQEFFRILNTFVKGPRGGVFIIYAHHLIFDLVSFFHDRWPEIAESAPGEYQFNYQSWKCTVISGPPCFARLIQGGANKSGGGNRTVWLIDTMAFFKTSLAKLADIFCPELPKLARPAMLGKHRYVPENKKFVAYAMRDAVIAYHVGKSIDHLHENYDLQQCVSAPHLSGRVFRHHYLKKMIPLPPKNVIYAAMKSYHGGKNGLYVRPNWYEKVRCVDISSAYPKAMSILPSFSNASLYKQLDGIGRIQEVPPFGVYQITGYVHDCTWPIIFNHSFKPIFGDIDKIWVTGFELNEALKTGEFEPKKIKGYFYDAELDNEPSPFAAFVDEFYTGKQKATDKMWREFFKIILNSLYGKFIQSSERQNIQTSVYDIDSQEILNEMVLVASGLFHPFIATLITGHTRAEIHHLEHRFKALHTATDGIITRSKIPVKAKPGLGELGIEAKGDAVILRNKLYIIYGPKGGQGFPSKLYKNKNIQKYAKHGFQGDVYTLERLAYTGNYSYTYIRANTLKESYRRSLRVNAFEKRRGTVKLEV